MLRAGEAQDRLIGVFEAIMENFCWFIGGRGDIVDEGC